MVRLTGQDGEIESCPRCGSKGCIHDRAPCIWIPDDYSWDAFMQAFASACARAWNDGHKKVTVTLPEGVFPEIASLQSPVTRDIVGIIRVPMFITVTESP